MADWRTLAKSGKFRIAVIMALYLLNAFTGRYLALPDLLMYSESRKSMERLDKAKTPEDRFYILDDVAKTSFWLGDIEHARQYANELATLAPTFRDDWNFGNAVHDSNMVLGQVALSEGDLEEAKRRLIMAGRTPGSPQLNSFGPNMSLARDLLRRGEVETVIQYFNLIRVFWGHDTELDLWIWQARMHYMPDFGANLIY